MAEAKKKTWLEVYLANYNGETEEAKSVKDYLKENYKGNSYIPWATMERLTYMQDPDAVFEKLANENGELVWTSSNTTFQNVTSDGVVKQETKAKMFGHFVKVKLTFMGKEFIEDYPIQDSDYTAVKAYDSNLINKALQRALAKVASRATGIGLKLYENKDLQIDEDNSVSKYLKFEEPKKPEIKINDNSKKVEEVKEAPVKVEETKEEPVKEEEPKVVEEPKVESSIPDDVFNLLTLIRNTEEDKIVKVLQRLNPAILSKFNFALNVTDTDEELVEKISKFEDVIKFTKAIEKQLEII